jgi:hypothetical protein
MASAASSSASANELDNKTVFTNPEEMEALTTPLSTRSGHIPIHSTTSIKRYVYPADVQNPENNIFMQCLSNEGAPGAATSKEYYYIHLNPYTDKHAVDDVSPILKNPDEFEVGAMYTFILACIGVRHKSDARGGVMVFTPCTDVALYAAKANNIFEHGTKHQQIFFRMSEMEKRNIESCAKSHKTGGKKGNPCFALFSSGEIYCTGPGQLQFNFFSGTYKMQKHVSSKAKVEHNETAFFTHIINTCAPSYTVGRRSSPFITSDTVPVTDSELQRLHAHGIFIAKFGSVQGCKELHREIRFKMVRNKSWPSNKNVVEELDRIKSRINFLGLYGESPSAVAIATAPAAASTIPSSSAHSAHGNSWFYTARSWVPPGIPGSKWNESKTNKRGGKDKRRHGKRTTVKRSSNKNVKRTRVSRHRHGRRSLGRH